MFKVICMFALVGLVAAAPVLQATQDQEAVISTIMSSLQPAIDAAIARALGENSVTTITVEGTYGIPTAVDALPALSGSFSGFQSSASYGSSGSYVDSQEQNGVDGATYHDTGYDHQHDGNSQHQQQNSFASTANYGVSKEVNSGTTLVSTAGAGGVVYHDASQVSNVNTVNSNANVQDVQTNVQTQVQQSEVTLSKAAQSQKLVSSVLNALAPSVEIAVQKALAAMMAQMQQQAVSTTSTTSQSSSSSSSVSASQELSLVTKIIEVLTPSIASSVRKALAARYEAQQAQAAFAAQQAAEEQAAQQQAAAAFAAQQEAAAAFAAQQEAAAAFAAQQEAAAALAAQQEAAAAFAAQQEAAAAFAAQQEAAAAFAAQQQAAAEYAAQQEAAAAFAAQQAAAQSSSALIAQIIAALKPSIATSVSSALEANRFSQQQQSQSFVSNNQASQQQSSQSSSSGLSNTSLSNIFGDGSAHNVKVETDSYQYEYNNSK